MGNICKVCEKECKNKFCSISCRNKFWNPIIKKGNIVRNRGAAKPKITEIRVCKCGNTFEVIGTEKYLKSKKSRKFCSAHCANSRHHSLNTINKIKNSIMNYINNSKQIKVKVCCICGRSLVYKSRSKFCSDKCKKEYFNVRYSNKDIIHEYRNKCKFKFNPFKYMDLLEVDLFINYGFYSPTNKKNNIEGASMDHRYSIMDGFDNNVDPYYMSHVMNCRILKHSINIAKGRRSEISLIELYRLVNEYDRSRGR